MSTRNRGFTLVELLAALAVGAILSAGLTAMILSAMQDNVSQQAALHHNRVANAAGKYLEANYAALVQTATDTTPVAVSVDQLKAAGLLPPTQQAANAYGQTPCLLVLQPQPGKLAALLVTEGGPAPIPAKDLPYVAAESGAGGGYVTADSPAEAQGVYGSWHVPAGTMGNYLSANCSGTAASAGHLASLLSNDGGDAADFVYRSAVPGHPELNRMTTPLQMAAVAVENDTADSRCQAADTNSQGRIATDAQGRVLSCEAGAWKAQGSAFWKDPVADFTDLPAVDNNTGDVRMVTALSRAFTWNGTAWDALAVDENGDMHVPGTLTTDTVALQLVAAKNDACSPDGSLARDATGLTLYCRSGSWRSFLETRVTTQAYSGHFSNGPLDPPLSTTIDVTALPGTRPLLMTASGTCQSSTAPTWNQHASIRIALLDATGATLGYQGVCDAATTWPNDTSYDQLYVALVKLPENAVALRIDMTGGVSTAYGDGADLQLTLLNSE